MNDNEINQINQQLSSARWDNDFTLGFDHIDEQNRLLNDSAPHLYIKGTKHKCSDRKKVKKRGWSQMLFYVLFSNRADLR